MRQKKRHPHHLTWAEIDLSAIRHNIRALKAKASKNQEILAVIKADAYGHGIIEVANLLQKERVSYYGVSRLREAQALRKAGIRTPILLFGNVANDFVRDLFKYHLTPTVCTLTLAYALSRYAQKIKKEIPVHIKIDTGMGRLGVPKEDALEFVRSVMRLSYLRIEGIYTHFPVADTDKEFTKKQIDYFFCLVHFFMRKGCVFRYIHASNSMGLIGYHHDILNLARPGLALYGLYPKKGLERKIKLKPAMTVKSRITFLKEIEKGQSVSYGRTYIAKGPRRIATVPIGYNDGYLRCFSNKAFMLVKGKRCPVVGRVTMDQTMIDVSAVKGVRENDEVVVLGSQRKECLYADELAEKAGTISYEIICGFGNRLPRIYKK